MTRRRTDDYMAVFEYIKKLTRYPAVTEFVSDFEKAIWSAVKIVFPSVRHYGCAFHWTQAIVKKVFTLFKFHRNLFILFYYFH